MRCQPPGSTCPYTVFLCPPFCPPSFQALEHLLLGDSVPHIHSSASFRTPFLLRSHRKAPHTHTLMEASGTWSVTRSQSSLSPCSLPHTVSLLSLCNCCHHSVSVTKLRVSLRNALLTRVPPGFRTVVETQYKLMNSSLLI